VLKEEGRGKKEEGRGKREEGRRKREEGRGKKEEGNIVFIGSIWCFEFIVRASPLASCTIRERGRSHAQ